MGEIRGICCHYAGKTHLCDMHLKYEFTKHITISMAWCKTAVAPFLTHWGYYRFVLSHWFILTGRSTESADVFYPLVRFCYIFALELKKRLPDPYIVQECCKFTTKSSWSICFGSGWQKTEHRAKLSSSYFSDMHFQNMCIYSLLNIVLIKVWNIISLLRETVLKKYLTPVFTAETQPHLRSLNFAVWHCC